MAHLPTARCGGLIGLPGSLLGHGRERPHRGGGIFFFRKETTRGRPMSLCAQYPMEEGASGAQCFSVVGTAPRTSSFRPHALPFNEEGSSPFQGHPCLLDEVIPPTPVPTCPTSRAGVAFYRCVVLPCFPSLSPTCQRTSQIGQGLSQRLELSRPSANVC